MKKKISLIIFDLDGVLINSKPNMKISWNKVRKKFNVKKNFSEYSKYIGYPFFKILNKLSIKKNQKEIHKTYNSASIKYLKKIKLYNGVKNELIFFRKKKIKMAIVTSKDRSRTIKIVKKFKIPIKHIVCPSKVARGKPYPDQINKAIKMAKANKAETAYVGDMPVDFLLSKNAKIKFIFAKYGYAKNKNFKYTIENFKNLRNVVNI